MTTTSLANLLFEHTAPRENMLIADEDRALTGDEMRTAVVALAAELTAAGVREGQPVVVQLPNTVRAVVAMLAIWVAKAVFVPLNSRAPAAERARVLDHIPAAAVIYSDGVHALRDTTPRQFDPDIAFVTWTSGTTGPPKAILHTHRGYYELLDRVLTSLRPARRDGATPPPNLVPVPLALNSGIYNALFGLRAGRAVVIMDRLTPAGFAKVVRRYGITSTVLPPAVIAMLAHEPSLDDLSPLRFVRSITAPLPPTVAKTFYERFGVFVLNGYGQAELGEVIGWTGADARNHPDKLGAVGRPHPGVRIKIVDPDGAVVDSGDIGQLLVAPPSLAAGFATGETLDDRIDAEGFVTTGDLAREDSDGFVWITGRMGEVINRGGNKVYPTEVEDVLRLSPSVADAAVAAAEDQRLGQVPVAFVIDADHAEAASDADLVALCRRHLVPYKVPTVFHRVTAIPRNEIGKVRRAELTKMHMELQ